MSTSRVEALPLWFLTKVKGIGGFLFDERACRAHEPGWKQSIMYGNKTLRGYGARRLRRVSEPRNGGRLSGTRYREAPIRRMRHRAIQTSRFR